MDPKLSNLDPKLREAYERVMNGSSSPTQPANGQPAAQTPAPQSIQQPIQSAQPAPAPMPAPQSQPQTQAAVPSLDPTPAVNSTIAYNAHNSDVNKGTTGVKKGGKSGKLVLIFLGIVIFLLLYTVIWVFILKLKLPFLP